MVVVVGQTVQGIARAGFLNQGQVCLAGSRIFVERPLLERFSEALVKEVCWLRYHFCSFLSSFLLFCRMKCDSASASLPAAQVSSRKIGDPSSADTFFGPLSSLVHREKVRCLRTVWKCAFFELRRFQFFFCFCFPPLPQSTHLIIGVVPRSCACNVCVCARARVCVCMWARRFLQVESYVAIAKEEGGTVLCGGVRPDLPAPFCDGAFFMPTIIGVRTLCAPFIKQPSCFSLPSACAGACACVGVLVWCERGKGWGLQGVLTLVVRVLVGLASWW